MTGPGPGAGSGPDDSARDPGAELRADWIGDVDAALSAAGLARSSSRPRRPGHHRHHRPARPQADGRHRRRGRVCRDPLVEQPRGDARSRSPMPSAAPSPPSPPPRPPGRTAPCHDRYPLRRPPGCPDRRLVTLRGTGPGPGLRWPQIPLRARPGRHPASPRCAQRARPLPWLPAPGNHDPAQGRGPRHTAYPGPAHRTWPAPQPQRRPGSHPRRPLLPHPPSLRPPSPHPAALSGPPFRPLRPACRPQ